ncbi:uncharacterized protein LOC143859013 [Tasmannia lanceolata]|uniref:uncharacterized protein LOC143859013 n=1 Tax=Tasmannia lanceolata TaxID=3420 RepID=UPI0040628FE9
MESLINNEDFLDSVLNLKKTHLNEGFKDRFNDGFISGKEEGREVGLKQKHGFEIGEELGFYHGFIDIWNPAIKIDPNFISSRVQKNIKQMEELICKYPILDPENVSIEEIMNGLSLKIRAISATMGLRLEHEGYPKASEIKEIEF